MLTRNKHVKKEVECEELPEKRTMICLCCTKKHCGNVGPSMDVLTTRKPKKSNIIFSRKSPVLQ